jgi:hypothetical protein
MPGHLEGSDDGRAPSVPPSLTALPTTPLPADHFEEPEWTRLLVTVAAQSLLPAEMPLAWLLGPENARAFCESGAPEGPSSAPGSDSTTWVVPRSRSIIDSVGVGRLSEDVSARASTTTGLVTLWQEGGSRCLLDLLAARSLAIDGPPIAVGFTLADLVVELASRRWSDLEEVCLVGFAREIPGLEQVRFLPGIGDAVALLSNPSEMDRPRSRCFVVAPGVSGARSHKEVRSLLALAEQVPSVGVVCCDTSARARCTWHLSSHRHTLRLETRRRSRLTAVLSPEHWVELTTVPQPRSERPALPVAERRLTSPHDEVAPRPVRRRFTAGPRAAAVEIDFLGPVQIIGAHESLERRRRLTELIVYMAFHGEGVSGEALATALWPDRRVPSQTVANRLHEARRALGATSDGLPRIRQIDGRHKLAGEVQSDWGRFQSLTGPGSTPASWYRAISLVRGRPFEGLSQGDWVGLEGAGAHVEAEIVEIAGRLGEHLLERKDPAGAAWAARRGIAAAPWDERLYRLLMRAADASGSRGAVGSALRWLAEALEWEGDPLDAVHPATARLYRKLTGPPADRCR